MPRRPGPDADGRRTMLLEGVGPVHFIKSRPPDLTDYVILHELIHLRHRGHGREFWVELERLMPDARRCQARLREYSLALF